ncbi:MAG: GumC family protein [Elainellaceae cyanobacterium]
MPVQSDRPPIHHNGHIPPYPVPVAFGAPSPESDDLNLVHLLHVARRRGWIIAGVAAVVTAGIWGWTLTRTPIYRGEFRVLIESANETDRSQQLLIDEQIGLQSTVDYDTQIEVLLSPVLLKPIAENLQAAYPDLDAPSLATHLSIIRLRETKVLAVSYRDPDSEKIRAVLSEVAQQYLDYSFDQQRTSLQNGIQFVNDQLPDLQDRVTNLQIRLERFRQEYSILDPELRGDELSTLLSSVEGQQQDLQAELTEARSLYANLQSQLGYSPDEALAASSLSESSRYQALLNQIQEIEAQIASESARFQPDSPQIQALEEQRDNLLPLLTQEANRILGDRLTAPIDAQLTATSIDLSRQLINAANQVQMLEARNRALSRVEQDLKQEFDLVPALARQYTDLQRELEIATESLNRFLATRETLQIDAAQKSVPWELISDPSVSQNPISPNVPRNLMLGAIAGLLAGTTAALLIEKLDDVFHSPEDLKAFTKLPILGVIPFLAALQNEQSTQALAKLLHAAGSRSAAPQQSSVSPNHAGDFRTALFSESFRSLYTNIRFLGADRPIQSLVISSAIPSEGKSTIAFNLAKAAATLGHRVLLVDADLRSPKHHDRLHLPNGRGLSNAITDQMALNQAIQRSQVDDNLFVMTAGPVPPDPVKLLSSQRMKHLIDQVTHHFDLVIYDTPPLLGFADSSVLAANTDGMALVVGLGQTDRTALSRALDELKMTPGTVLGVIANGIKSHTTRSYGYYRYYQHYYSRTPSSHSNGRVTEALSTQNGRSQNGRSPHPPSPVHTLARSTSPMVSPPDGTAPSNDFVATLNASPLSWTESPWLWWVAGLGVAAVFGIAGWMVYTRWIGTASMPAARESSEAIAPDRSPDANDGNAPQIRPATVDDPFAEAVRIAQEAVSEGEIAQSSEDWYVLAVQWKQASELMASVSNDDPRYDVAQDRMEQYRQNSEFAYQKAEVAAN